MDHFENQTVLISESNFFLDKKKIFFYVGIILFLFISFYFIFLSAPLNFPKGEILKIEQGQNPKSIATVLKNNHFITSKLAFEFFVIIYGGEKHISPGDYLFEKKLPVFEIARRMAEGKYSSSRIKITIPEGFDVDQMADVFSTKLTDFNKANFLAEAKDKEGYLFPDTYFFFSTSTEKEVLEFLENNFQKKISTIQSELNNSNKNEKDIITMASIIEREAKGDTDRGIISGILWNRISKNMPLQVDAAPETYKTKGLPDSPICNPGLKAIEAAINPVSSSYLYYLHDKNGLVHYAKTFAEHKQNKILYLK